MKVLLVEDSATDVTLFRMALRSLPASFELSVADDGDRALTLLHDGGTRSGARRPDYIVLDLNLPRRDGFEILGEIKSDPLLSGIPVIVLSSSRGPDEVARAYDLQAAAYFVKPLSEFDQVVSGIVRYIDAARRGGSIDAGSFTGAVFANLAAGGAGATPAPVPPPAGDAG